MKVYLASGWFTPKAAEEVEALENLLGELGLNVASPRKIFVCPPNAPLDVQKDTFKGNVEHIRTADFVLCNTRDKDMGTIFEAGVAFNANVPIVYFAQGLTGNFNLMLAQSGVKVTSSYDELRNYLTRCISEGKILFEPFYGEIE
jgi:nucleoside 2-deoxyribosyltransferase